MKTTIQTIFFLVLFNLNFGQTYTSAHSVKFFKNNFERKVNVLEIWIIVDGTIIPGEKVGKTFQLPLIDNDQIFEFYIKTNKMEFETCLPLKAWKLNNGSNIVLGKITRIEKLNSVAKDTEMKELDKGYDYFSKHFFIADERYTIEINESKKIRRLDYLIINPNEKGDGTYIIQQKKVKQKKK